MKRAISIPLFAAIYVAILSSLLLCQEKPAPTLKLEEPYYDAFLPAASGEQFWDKDYLITYGFGGTHDAHPSKPAIVLYDKYGKVAHEGIAWLKDTDRTSISHVAVSRTGRIVFAGGASNSKGVIRNFIGEINDKGVVGRVIRTSPFLAKAVCIDADDGTVWALGRDRDDLGYKNLSPFLLRQYSFTKDHKLVATLDATHLSKRWRLISAYPTETSLRCIPGRVVVYSARADDYVEYNTITNTLKVAKVEPVPPFKEAKITGFALTDRGDAYISLDQRNVKAPRGGLFKLQFDSSGLGKWIPIENTVGLYGKPGTVEYLWGTDGSNLIYSHDWNGRAYWSAVTAK